MPQHNPIQSISYSRHILQNALLIALSLALLPFTTFFIVFPCVIYSRLFHNAYSLSTSAHTQKNVTILITNTEMTKGLALCRAFKKCGYRVVGADVLRELCRRSTARGSSPNVGIVNGEPSSSRGKGFVDGVLRLTAKHNISLWISVSSAFNTVEEAEASLRIKERCTTFIFPPTITKQLHDKHAFIEFTHRLGFTVPESHKCTSAERALAILYGKDYEKSTEAPAPLTNKRFIMKCIPLDDITRSDLTVYPLPTFAETTAALLRLGISEDKPFLLQEYIVGKEYTMHGVVVDGELTAFAACESADVLMHYRPLHADSPVFKAMREFSQAYAKYLTDPEGRTVTGQMSFDFLATKKSGEDDAGEGIVLYPIECNPRTHTAVILFAHDPAQLVAAYSCALKPRYPLPERRPIVPTTRHEPLGHYWIGHDLVTLVFLPILRLRLNLSSLCTVLEGVTTFLFHVPFWKEAVWELSDPLPWWWMYHVYWPSVFLGCLITGKRWSRVNVSTGRVFECT
ncbi:hypothetical protein BDZ91DRAFT_662701 [Kalaharituber pfeilii]|nr:hypothetical protein BDZ91DRAFT_662701 [Kalaharituber pfeilii]